MLDGMLTVNKDQGFSRLFRVRRQADFDRAYRRSTVAADDVLVIHGSPNDLAHSRLGLSISRKVGNAIVRNRWKRLIRECFRQQRTQLPVGYDFVVRPRRGAVADYHAIGQSLLRLTPLLVKRLSRTER
jgi:ribonuclease P protein component